MQKLFYSSPFWISGVYYIHERFHPDYMKWGLYGGIILFGLWLIGRVYAYKRAKNRMQKEWGEKHVRNKTPQPVQQMPVVYQMPIAYNPQVQQAPVTWSDLPADRYEL